ncbi:MAG TPA: DUF4403 family protein [Gemmatimonadales bacterium]
MSRSIPFWVALALPGCQGRSPPEVVEDEIYEEPRFDLPPSYVSAPLQLDLRPLLRELEAAVPRQIGSVDKAKRLQVSNKAWVAPELSRGPFRFAFAGNRVTVSAIFEYRAKAWFKPFLVEQAVSCGMGKERPRIRVSIATTYDLTADWRLKTDSRLLNLEPVSATERDQCEITFLKIDVTGRVIGAAEAAMQQALTDFDLFVGRVSIRGPVEGIWEKLKRPISIAEGALWLQIRPREVSLGRITAGDSTLVARLDLLASPRILSGPRPLDDTVSLPALGRTITESDTAVVLIEGLLVYAAANQLMAEALVGRTVGKGWKRVTVDAVSMRAAGRGRVALAVTVSGRSNGVVNVVGTPTYDPEQDRISVPDLVFDVKSQGFRERLVGLLLGGPFLIDLRRLAVFPAAGLLAQAVELANREVNRELSDGIQLRGSLGAARTMHVQATRRGLVAQARGSGRLWLEISKEDLLPSQLRASRR